MFSFSILLALYYLLHSFLADSSVKKRLSQLPLLKNYYRIFFNATAILLLLPLWRAFPTTFLVERKMWAMMSGYFLFFAGLLIVTLAIRQYSLSEFSGMDKLNGKSSEDQPKLNTSGINSMVRHPLYLGILLACWGLWLYWPAGGSLMTAIITSLYLPLGIYLEERKLIAEFGEAYINYQQEVPMIFPRR